MSKKPNRYDTSTFVSPGAVADGEWRPLEPAQLPAVGPGPATTPAQPVVIDVGGDKSFSSIQGSHKNRSEALLLRAAPVIIIEGVTIAGLMLLGYLQYRANASYFGAGWLVLTGIAGLVTFLQMNAQDHAHSPDGVQRQRNELTAEVAVETHETTVNAWRDVQLTEIKERYSYLGKVADQDHEQRIKRLGGSRDDKRLPGPR